MLFISFHSSTAERDLLSDEGQERTSSWKKNGDLKNTDKSNKDEVETSNC